jgi:hypothetical protein
MSDTIPPHADDAFNPWQLIFSQYVVNNAVALGVTVTEKDDLTASRDNWDADYNTHNAAEAAAKAATVAKNDARAAYEDLIRPLIARFQASTTITDEQRELMDIPVHKKTKTPISIPTTRPVAEIATGTPGQHTLHFRDLGAATKAKPPGVMGAEIWCHVGTTPPAGPAACTLLGLDTNSPYLAVFETAQSGQKAFYYLRWINKRGQPGPWSDLSSAVIG